MSWSKTPNGPTPGRSGHHPAGDEVVPPDIREKSAERGLQVLTLRPELHRANGLAPLDETGEHATVRFPMRKQTRICRVAAALRGAAVLASQRSLREESLAHRHTTGFGKSHARSASVRLLG